MKKTCGAKEGKNMPMERNLLLAWSDFKPGDWRFYTDLYKLSLPTHICFERCVSFWEILQLLVLKTEKQKL